MRKKPKNATWTAKHTVSPTDPGIDYPPDTQANVPLADVDLYWYPDGKCTIVLKHAGPAVLSQVYLAGKGQDVIVQLMPNPAAAVTAHEELTETAPAE